MPLTPEDVSRIAHLARLELSPAEGSAMQTQLNEFFKIVEQMSADVVTETDNRAANMANAPAAEAGLFLVPKVIE
ncbi:MAG: aspartyl/glutamyl-tRNA amidotransferase subunit C [Burkholderiales bacterium]|nr:aspartyl/glutamyl-tRNA amidotransferase subunit C [Burkholderiales bacterium]